MNRFDQDPDAPYARCTAEGCGFVAATREEMDEHARETSTPTGETVGIIAQSHPYRVVNPTRAERIQRHIDMEASDAIDNAVSEFVESVYRLHSREGVPLSELTAAVARAQTEVDFRSAWGEYIEEDEDDDDLDSDSPADVQLHQETALFDLGGEA